MPDTTRRNFGRSMGLVAALLPAFAGIVAAGGLAGQAIAAEASYEGKAVAVGHGTARVVIRTDAKGEPATVAVMLSRGALDGLPAELNPKNLPEGEWEYALGMPAKGPRTGYTHVVIDWNPYGHPPPDVYTVPHFDFHFYMMSSAERAKVAFPGGPADPAAQAPAPSLLAAGYQVVPETAVPKMGVHAIDVTAPEFHGKPFTATFIYGYYQGRLTFVEPMVTRAFLQTKPDFTSPVPAPAAYSLPGHYPSRYSVRYDAAKKAYFLELGGLKPWTGKADAQSDGGKEPG